MGGRTAAREYIFKFVITGDSGVGKTKLVERLRRNEFTEDSHATIGVEFALWRTEIDGDLIKTQLWDTAGQERYSSILTPNFYRGSAGAMIVYDITNRDSFLKVTQWMNLLHDACGSPDFVVILVGNKSDLADSRVVSTAEGSAFAAENGLSFIETSARDASNVEVAFNDALREIHRIHSARQTTPLPDKSAIRPQNEREPLTAKRGCC